PRVVLPQRRWQLDPVELIKFFCQSNRATSAARARALQTKRRRRPSAAVLAIEERRRDASATRWRQSKYPQPVLKPRRAIPAGLGIVSGGHRMASNGLPVDRLRDYLRELKPEARALLMAELERGRLRGEELPAIGLILQELREAAPHDH